jgi:hypothetical protein
MRQFRRQDRRLHAVEPAVDALDLVQVFDQPAMARQHGHVLGKLRVAGDDGARVAHRAEILARIERIGRSNAEAADLLAFIARQVRLRAILHHPELGLARDRHDRIHIRGLSV